MRASYWLITGALIVGVAVIAFWPTAVYRQSPSPPGQYPLDTWRPEWVATPSIGRYRPVSSRDQDLIGPTGYRDAKMRSGGNRKMCVLPTVPLGPQLQLELTR